MPGYRLIKPLGTGGFGEVWMCEAPGGILKAIKFVYGNLTADDGGNRPRRTGISCAAKGEGSSPSLRFDDRAHSMFAKANCSSSWSWPTRACTIAWCEQQEAGRLGIPREHPFSYLSDAAEGLDYLIERYNLLHLDVKPRNLFLVGNHVKVADFGLVKNLERQSSSGPDGRHVADVRGPGDLPGQICPGRAINIALPSSTWSC